MTIPSARLVVTLSLVLAGSSASAAAEPNAPPWAAPPSPIAAPAPEDFPQPPPALERMVRSQIELLRRTNTVLERDRAVARLVEAGSAAIPLLIEELERGHRATRMAMVYTLGATGDPRVIPVLERELGRLQAGPYMEVLYALTLAGEPSALLRAMRSTYAMVSFGSNATAVDFIAGAIGPPAVPLLIREIPRRAKRSRIAGLGALGTICDDAATGFLLRWARHPQPDDRRFALIALARIGSPHAVDALLAALDSNEESVREAAIEGLGYLRDPRAVPKLVEILERDDRPRRTDRLRAIWTLGLIGGAEARRALIGHWERSAQIPQERVLIVRALGRLEVPEAVPLLTEAASGDGAMAADAARALVEIPGTEALDGLLEVCSEASSLDAALHAAQELVKRGDPRCGPCVVARIKQEIESKNRLGPRSEEILDRLPGVARRGAARSLRALAEEVPAPAIAQRLRSCGHEIELTIDLGSDVDPWLELLEEGTPDELELAIRRLGELGDPRAVQPLRDVFGQIDPSKAHLVPQSLARIDSERAVPFLISLLCDELYDVPSLTEARNEAARALVSLSDGDHVVNALRRAYLDGGGRFFVPLMALAKIRGPEGIDELLELKTLLLRYKGRRQVLRHERVNWAIRMLRTGQPIPLSMVEDVR